MLRAYYSSLQERERLVLWLGLACAVALLAYLIWRPLSESNHRLKQQVSEKQALVDWMEQASDEIRQLRMAGADIEQSSVPIQQLITRGANLQHLPLERMHGSDTDQAQLWLDNADFNSVLVLLEQLHGDGVILLQAQLRATASPGRVKAQLTFGR